MSFHSVAENEPVLVGVIADTHGVLTTQAIEALQGVDLIIHAGDAEEIEVLEELAQIAPVEAVRGNVDWRPGLGKLPSSLVTQIGDTMIFTIHDLLEMDIDPAAAGFEVVIYGHSHRTEMRRRNGVLYLNPGSASFPRMGSERSIALLRFGNGNVELQHKNLD